MINAGRLNKERKRRTTKNILLIDFKTGAMHLDTPGLNMNKHGRDLKIIDLFLSHGNKCLFWSSTVSSFRDFCARSHFGFHRKKIVQVSEDGVMTAQMMTVFISG